MKKDVGDKGEPPVTRTLQEFDEGDQVAVRIDPSIQAGMPHPRFHGLTGTVSGKQGEAFTVKVNDGGKEKTVIARPEHLKAV
jgi:large subunit ribosomal protein L21e